MPPHAVATVRIPLQVYRRRPELVVALANGESVTLIHPGGQEEQLSRVAFDAQYVPARLEDVKQAIAPATAAAAPPPRLPAPAPRARRNGVKKRAAGPRHEARRPKPAPEKPIARRATTDGRGPKWDVAEGLELWKAGKTYVEIASLLGSTKSAVSVYAYNHGWPKRARGHSVAKRSGKNAPEGDAGSTAKRGAAGAPFQCWNCREVTHHSDCCHLCGADKPHKRDVA